MRKLALVLSFMMMMLTLASEQTIGSFTVTKTVDELTDEVNIIAYSKAVSHPSLANDAALVLRCNGDDFDIFIYADKFLTIEDKVPIQYKIDGVLVKDPTQFNASTKGTSAFAFAPMAFLVDLVNGDGSDMVVRLWDYQSTPYTYKFNLSGLMRVLKIMKPVCIDDEIPKPKW